MIETPNLPSRKVKLLIMQNASEAVRKLRALGLSVLTVQKNTILEEEVSEHADMLLCHLGGKDILLEPEQTELFSKLTAIGFTCRFSSPLETKYPRDIKLNVALGKDFALGNFKFVDETLQEHVQNSGKTLLPVSQGYAKCNLCFVNDRAFITEDEGIKNALTAIGKDVLLIRKGDVILSKKHYGFFGGAAGKIDRNIIAVNGSLKYHRDSEKISDFLQNHGVSPLELSDGPITDIGGILPIE